MSARMIKNSEKKIRSAVIGLGRIGQSLENDSLRVKPATHAGAISENQNCELVAGVDPDLERRTEFTRRFGVPSYENLSEAMSESEINVVHIATPVETHFQLLQDCLKLKNIKVIVCEKPLVQSAEEASIIRAATENTETTIITNYSRRYSKRYEYLRSIIAERNYGSLLSMHGCVYYGAKRSWRNMLISDGAHLINTLQMLTDIDSPGITHAVLAEGSKGHGLNAILSFGGLPATIEVAPGSSYLLFEIQARFERGRAIINNEDFSVYAAGPGNNFEKFKTLSPIVMSPVGETSPMANLVDEVVAIFEKGGKAKSNLESAVASVVTIEEIFRAVDSK